ncbi:hypothetical protein [Nocardiopsis sp. FIRDI 009]|uniref:hypothetical protein n=1 Tax=Nocardiopsis sp. FIRDI 009 TaxID=714197 RepID=UPI00130075CA|nr:hypothetical protein [Nocardiopsis sp. FIRDI 009]
MKFELVDPPEDAVPDVFEPEAKRPLTGRRSPVGGDAVPRIGPIQDDLGRVRLNRAVEQVRAVVEDLRARAAAQSMAELQANDANMSGPVEEFKPLLFRARNEKETPGTDVRSGDPGGSGKGAR